MWGSFILAGSPKAQLIMHCLQQELWQSASIMHWVKSANSGKRVDE
jgi:predicted transcriptional regulator